MQCDDAFVQQTQGATVEVEAGVKARYERGLAEVKAEETVFEGGGAVFMKSISYNS